MTAPFSTSRDVLYCAPPGDADGARNGRDGETNAPPVDD